MKAFLKGVFATTAVVGLLVTVGSAIVLGFAHDWASFTAAYVGMALLAVSAIGFRAADRQQA